MASFTSKQSIEGLTLIITPTLITFEKLSSARHNLKNSTVITSNLPTITICLHLRNFLYFCSACLLSVGIGVLNCYVTWPNYPGLAIIVVGIGITHLVELAVCILGSVILGVLGGSVWLVVARAVVVLGLRVSLLRVYRISGFITRLGDYLINIMILCCEDT